MGVYKIKAKNGEIVEVEGQLFTGQHDKQGTPIYEGDVIEWVGRDMPFSSRAKEKARRSKVVYYNGVDEQKNRSRSGFRAVDMDNLNEFGCVAWCPFYDCKVVNHSENQNKQEEK